MMKQHLQQHLYAASRKHKPTQKVKVFDGTIYVCVRAHMCRRLAAIEYEPKQKSIHMSLTSYVGLLRQQMRQLSQ